ncbi:RING finger protein [Halotydeus destructor]|nr:RING finger protein [Halotydeus destructor]
MPKRGLRRSERIKTNESNRKKPKTGSDAKEATNDGQGSKRVNKKETPKKQVATKKPMAVQVKADITTPLHEAVKLEFVCSVCQDVSIKAHGLHCSHVFCEYCIKRWLAKNSKCPSCRKKSTRENLCPMNSVDKIIEVYYDGQPEEAKKERKKSLEEREKCLPELEKIEADWGRRSRHDFMSHTSILDSDDDSGDSDDFPFASTRSPGSTSLNRTISTLLQHIYGSHGSSDYDDDDFHTFSSSSDSDRESSSSSSSSGSDVIIVGGVADLSDSDSGSDFGV